MSAKSLFPHQQLNWLSINLEKDLGRSKDKVSVYNQLALVHMSMALFHDGDESDCAKALAYSKKALLENPESVVALALAQHGWDAHLRAALHCCAPRAQVV